MIKQRQKARADQRFPQQKSIKYNTISPYISEIERRKKIKSVNKTHFKIHHETSQKSFRIKQQRSSSSLHGNLLNYDENSKCNLINKHVKKQNEQYLVSNKEPQIKEVQKGKQVSNGLMAKLAKIKAGSTTSSQMKDKRKLNFSNKPADRNPDFSLNSQLSKTVDNHSHSGTNDIISLLNKQQYTQNGRKTPHTTKNVSLNENEPQQRRQIRSIKLQRQKSNQKSNQFFKDLYSKIKSNKKNKNNGKGTLVFQRSAHKYDVTSIAKQKSVQKQNTKESHKKFTEKQIQKIDYQKLGYTDVGTRNKNHAQVNAQFAIENTQNVIKKAKNFRKNKYEALHSSVTSKNCNFQFQKQQKTNQIFKSQNNLTFDLEKKESNASLNKQMDDMAARQMKRFYRQKRGKQIEKSIQKSTEKYLGQDNYRPLKSKNDIQIFLSMMTNPHKSKQSRESTLNSSNKHNSVYISFNKDQPKNKKQILSQQNSIKVVKQITTKNFLDYDFNFGDQYDCVQIQQIDNASQEESLNLRKHKPLSTFQQQRKKVEIDFFNKEAVNIQWSQDQVVN